MNNLKVHYKQALGVVKENEIDDIIKKIIPLHQQIHDKKGKGNDFLGWVDLPEQTNFSIIEDINKTTQNLKEKVELVVVIGIGGSYLGARAVIDALNHNFSFLRKENDYPHIVYAGNNIGEDYLADLLEVLNQKTYALLVISKSGTTTEPAIAFRILKNHLENKVGKRAARDLIIAITDKAKGALKTLSDSEGYKSYIIPDDVGGRYSVLTPVGLLPIALAGIDIQSLIKGALDMQKITSNIDSPVNNPSIVYAAVRNALYKKGKSVEILASYTPSLQYIIEWWKQLYGESEGKENKGIFPAGVNFTCDLHSMGQYIQEGERFLFETVISIKTPRQHLLLEADSTNLDGLNFLSGKRLHEINRMAELGTALAHVDGGVPNISIEIPELNPYYLGQLIYFFEKACAYSGYFIDVNPFDQPGVEAYKKNMFALLGKPGFEKETELLLKRI